jgi:hypothetical protein
VLSDIQFKMATKEVLVNIGTGINICVTNLSGINCDNQKMHDFPHTCNTTLLHVVTLHIFHELGLFTQIRTNRRFVYFIDDKVSACSSGSSVVTSAIFCLQSLLETDWWSENVSTSE